MTYKNHNTYGVKNDLDDCKARGLILACGQGSCVEFLEGDPQTQIAFVEIDLSHLKKPKVLIEFSSTITFNGAPGLNNQLNYELFRVCDNKEPMLLGRWLFDRRGTGVTAGASIETAAFNFNFCECLKYSGCCQYFVTVTPIRFITAFALITVKNPRIIAIAQSSIN